MYNRQFDYFIAGAGISGCVCAYLLCRLGYSCLVLEKENIGHEKICGGGVPRKAINLLSGIDISINPLYNSGATKIFGHKMHFSNGLTVDNVYRDDEFALGVRRLFFDDYLRKQAQAAGAIVRFGADAKSICYSHSRYFFEDNVGKKFICAVGARGISGKPPYGQSFGISTIIDGESLLQSNRFYFWYLTATNDSYFWAFPVSTHTWNVGVWYRVPSPDMLFVLKSRISWLKNSFFPYGFSVIIPPKGEFLGNIDQTGINGFPCEGLGDFAGTNNPLNGGGIIYAIASSINYVERTHQMKVSFDL